MEPEDQRPAKEAENRTAVTIHTRVSSAMSNANEKARQMRSKKRL